MSNPPRRSCKDRLRTGASPVVQLSACPHRDSNLDWTRSERVASSVGLQGRADPGIRTPTVVALNHVPLPVGPDPLSSERPEGIEPSASVWKTDVSAEFTTTARVFSCPAPTEGVEPSGNGFGIRSASEARRHCWVAKRKPPRVSRGRLRGHDLGIRSWRGAPRHRQQTAGDEGENSPSRKLRLGKHVFLRLISRCVDGPKLCDGRTAVQRI